MKITIIGAGNMGGSIARGLAAARAARLTVCDVAQPVLDRLKADCPDVITSTDNVASVPGADVVIVAVKPWLVPTVVETLRPLLDLRRQLFVSIAAGVTFADLDAMLGDTEAPLFRIIPNTAIAVGQSLTLMSACRADEEQTATVRGLFDLLGRTVLIPEDHMAAGTAITSCGIAYAFQYIKAAIQGAIELGYPAAQARDMIDQTILGAIRLMETNGTMPDAEIYKVCTPGGITIKGLNEMAARGFDDAVISGLRRAAQG